MYKRQQDKMLKMAEAYEQEIAKLTQKTQTVEKLLCQEQRLREESSEEKKKIVKEWQTYSDGVIMAFRNPVEIAKKHGFKVKGLRLPLEPRSATMSDPSVLGIEELAREREERLEKRSWLY